MHTKADLQNSKNRARHKEFYGENTVRDIVDVKIQAFGSHQYSYGPSRFDPVLPGARSRFEEVRLVDNLAISSSILYWKIHADNAEVKVGNISLDQIEIVNVNTKG